MMMQARSVDASQQTGGDISHVSLDADNLTREEQISALNVLQRGTQKFWRRDEGVAMHLSVTNELGVLQTWNEAEYSLLFGIFEIGLKAHEIVETAS